MYRYTPKRAQGAQHSQGIRCLRDFRDCVSEMLRGLVRSAACAQFAYLDQMLSLGRKARVVITLSPPALGPQKIERPRLILCVER